MIEETDCKSQHNSYFRRQLLISEIQDLNRIAVQRNLAPFDGDVGRLSASELRSVADHLVQVLRTPSS